MLTILPGDCLARLRELPDESVHMCCTSPPYWGLRSYVKDGAPEKPYELGLEPTPELYVARMVKVFREVRRVLRKDSTCWVNLGDSYATNGIAPPHRGLSKHCGQPRGMRSIETFSGPSKITPAGLKPKDLVGIPWRMAFALRDDGWWLRSDIIWSKPSAMPESVTDRPTRAHEYIFLLSKHHRYFYDREAIKEPGVSPEITAEEYADYLKSTSEAWYQRTNDPFNGARKSDNNLMAGKCPPGGRNKRSVWTVPSQAYSEAHFATYPPDLIKPCILAGTSARGCCPKCGAPWERVIREEPIRVKHDYNGKHLQSDKTAAGRNILASVRAAREAGGPHDNPFPAKQTLGWRPTCKCGEPQTVPCTVLDPFAGSGTTGAVSLELGRRAILIELNPQYVELIKRRCAVTPGLQLA